MHWGRVFQILQPAIHKSWTNDVHKQLVPLGDVRGAKRSHDTTGNGLNEGRQT